MIDSREFNRFLQLWDSKKSFRVSPSPGSSASYLLAKAVTRRFRPFCAIYPDERRAEIAARELKDLTGKKVEFYPALDPLPEGDCRPDAVLIGERNRILSLLAHLPERVPLLVTTAAAIRQPVPDPENIREEFEEIIKGEEADLLDLIRWLAEKGYFFYTSDNFKF